MASHLDRGTAARRDLPDVVHALQDFLAARLGMALIRKPVGDKVDVAGGGVHRPEVIPFVIAIGELGVFFLLNIHHPKIRGVAASVMLAPPHHGMPVENQFAAVGRVAAPIAPIGRDRLLPAVTAGTVAVTDYAQAKMAYEKFRNDPDAFVLLLGFIASGARPRIGAS